MASSKNLLTKEKLHAKLYDAECMLEIKGSVASGFIVLLNGAPPSPKTKKDKKKSKKKSEKENDAVTLAFMSLTSGNVVDACFGVVNPSRKDETPARRSAKEAKGLLDTADTTDSFRQIAVTAYCDAFKAVVTYNAEMDKLNCITKCFRSKKIRTQAAKNIENAFGALVLAMKDTTE
mmetsp:Transcript_12469/g.26396  ORF Transcript_12469/g.26396 Transcript_12469/m.26396 type:complete len:177 (+) Transcript_12469:266-796(+)|eukprot:CAMPEP_0201134948 /NCGR_PEP_ID=MMETSP0850-20130426/53202_1 /ASSEMBLY_ACC=CAM_ASM_000622 /TAXON_ID=183588 /ORGANISM="Pseudo-nitzschia fraudulenta, Strain WWA7" /LENGTH=176 /DNA_ID=CAMNT_0047406027 /DNA_START=263 /DNA_END=793 /DNA_ORIENTATION=+